jgi:hypothetical protein
MGFKNQFLSNFGNLAHATELHGPNQIVLQDIHPAPHPTIHQDRHTARDGSHQPGCRAKSSTFPLTTHRQIDGDHLTFIIRRIGALNQGSELFFVG